MRARSRVHSTRAAGGSVSLLCAVASGRDGRRPRAALSQAGGAAGKLATIVRSEDVCRTLTRGSRRPARHLDGTHRQLTSTEVLFGRYLSFNRAGGPAFTPPPETCACCKVNPSSIESPSRAPAFASKRLAALRLGAAVRGIVWGEHRGVGGA